MSRRKMPSMSKLIAYWVEHYEGAFPDLIAHWIGWGDPFCFACSWRVPVHDGPRAWHHASRWLDRAHLQDRWIAGDDSPANIVPLCHECHHSMPMFENRDDAIAWVNEQERASQLWQLFTDATVSRNLLPDRARTVFFLRAEYAALRRDALLLDGAK